MSSWRPQHHRKLGALLGADATAIANSEAVGRAIVRVDSRLQPVFSLRHLAALTHVDYAYLRDVVSRTLDDPYRLFTVRKSRVGPKAGNFRVICVPEPDLMRAQRWIARRILAAGRPHSASYAYAPGSKIRDAAMLHCGHPWLIKLDVQRFFESVSELSAFHVFMRLGYQPLVAFELSRLCTRLGKPPRRARWLAGKRTHSAISAYQHHLMGHLPQGAPTSPMLANLAMEAFDHTVAMIAERAGLYYTRYADDIALSSPDLGFGRRRAAEVIGGVYAVMARFGLSPNRTKAQVVPPGARKIVLGLLVDSDRPRLTREFRAGLRQHIYYLKHPAVGPVLHARHRGFASVCGLRNHINGLVRYAHDIDPSFAASCHEGLTGVAWP